MTPTVTSAQPEPARFTEADVLKVVSIVAVVLIHSTRSLWDPSQSTAEYWLKQTLRFAVPGFLAVSGFLYATHAPVPLALSLRRLRRVLFPYLVASICAEAFWAFRGEPRDLTTIGFNLVIANSFGQYYYVFVLIPLVLISPLLARIPLKILWLFFVTGVVLQGLFEAQFIGNLHPLWRVRNPTMWWPYFVLGWLARLHYQGLRSWVAGHRPVAAIVLCACLLACSWVPGIPEMADLVRVTSWLGIYFAIALIFVLSCDRGVHGSVRWLSDATYSIYLLHLFFVIPGVAHIRAEFGAFEPVTIASIWCIGLIGPVGIVLAARAVLGDRSRDIVGA